MGSTWFLNKWAPITRTQSSTTVRTRRRDCIELVTIYALVLLILWTPQPWQWPLWAIAILTACAVIALSYQGRRSMGICTENLLRALWAVPLSLALAAAAILLAARMHTLHVPQDTHFLVRHFGIYVVWAALQQLMLQCFVLARSVRLLPNATAAAALAAAMFATAHLPNPVLTVVTLVCGLASCLFFLHYRNLWPLAIAHAVLGIAIAITVPNSIDHNMCVGIGYLDYVNPTALSQTVMSTKP